MDVADFENICVFPTPVLFWNCHLETLARNRNPIFDPAIGVYVQTHVTVDILHALFLGVALTFCKEVVWKLILAGAWGSYGAQEEMYHTAVLAIRVS
jgi:hypothetical protein